MKTFFRRLKRRCIVYMAKQRFPYTKHYKGTRAALRAHRRACVDLQETINRHKIKYPPYIQITRKDLKDTFLYDGIRKGFITVRESGAMSYNVKEFVRSTEAKTRLRNAISSTRINKEKDQK